MNFVVLPAYNEYRALTTLVPQINAALEALGEPYKIVVANDGSRDQTAELLKDFSGRMPLQEVRHAANQGYGAALRSAYRCVLEQGPNEDAIVISLDADGTHSPVFFAALIAEIRRGNDMVTASYAMPGGSLTGVPRYRAILSHGVNWLFKIGSPVPGAQTYSNGFRAYRIGILQKVAKRFGEELTEENGFAGGAELFLKAAAVGGRASEVPFDLHYELRGKDSKIRFVPTIKGYLKLILRARRGFNSGIE